MYTKYFGLKENPFSTAPDPRYLFMSDMHREALAHLLYGISSADSFILLTGAVGTGKTTLCRYLVSQLPNNADVALLANLRLTVLGFYEMLCAELAVPVQEGERTVQLYSDALKHYLVEAQKRGRNTALLLDEAQSLNGELLEELRLLSNLESNGKKLLKIVLLGQPELRQVLETKGTDQISQHITSHYHLLSLDEEDVLSYVRYRLAVAGGKGKIFTKAALARIYEFSQGIPRLVNVLCDRALLIACIEKKYLVDGKVIEQAAKEVKENVGKRREQGEGNNWLRIIVPLVFLSLLAVGAVAIYLSLQTAPQSEIAPLPGSSGSVASSLQGTEEAGDKEGEAEGGKRQPGHIRIVPLEIRE